MSSALSHAHISTPFIKKTQIISTNEFGADILFGKNYTDQNVVDFFEESNLKIIIITKGENGAEVYTRDHIIKQTHSYIPKVLDTTGAGDCFNATFLFAILHKYSLEESLTLANKAGAYATTYFGARNPFTFDTIKNL